MPDRLLVFLPDLMPSKNGLIFCLILVFMLSPVQSSAETDRVAGLGSIRGEVRITEKLSAPRMRFRIYPEFRPIPPPNPDERREDEWQNIVVYIKSVASAPGVISGEKELKVTQQGETFIPHILPVMQGSTVQFPNQDPIFHNVFSLSGAKTFDLGRYPKGESRSVTFDRPGIVPVFCHIHSDMSAVILVLENPYFAVPDSDGLYQIDGVPEGNYTLVAWHERSGPVEYGVKVIAGQALELDISVPIEDEESDAR